MKHKIVPDVIGSTQDLAIVAADVSVREAARTMAQRKIGAVMVGERARLEGIFTERDLLTKIVAANRDPDAVTVGEVMTRNPDTIGPNASAHEALQQMSDRGYRHLPVTENGRIVGMVSVRDIYGAMLQELEEELHDREAFIQGSAGYGLT
jgi:CBS domain-containing protein